MKNIIGALILGVITSFVSTHAQKSVSAWGWSSPPATVPIEVAVKGRGAMISFLSKNLSYVLPRYEGQSVMNPGESPAIWLDWLERYEHKGSLIELSAALAEQSTILDLVPTPSGGFDIRMDLKYYTEEGLAFVGWGYPHAYYDNDGVLRVTEAQPTYYLNSHVAVRTKGSTTAKLLGYGRWPWDSMELAVTYDGDTDTSLVYLPTSKLERGYLAIDSRYKGGQDIVVYDLANDTKFEGKSAVVRLGEIQGGDIIAFENVDTISFPERMFYKSDGKVYGRYPVIEVMTSGIKELTHLTIPVWRTDEMVQPSRIVVEVVTSNAVLPEQFELQKADEFGEWIMVLPEGIYHIRAEFDDVLDWDLDPNPKG